ncbi:MAG TPA: LysR family transcriptional regulator [Kineosporiaceae bacterium]|jgi:DNA-binding transcriptional LysR family regulator|nr:LysR family transcriptional regulator [Kineosporiaceae bacterium]
MLDVHRLRVFRSVVASGSIQAAAVNLGYTPSAVSQQVSALQRETGLALLTRVGRGVQPTSAGRALAAQVDGVLERLGEVELAVADLREGRNGTLSIGYFASAGSAWMPHVVRTLSTSYPDLRLDLGLRDGLPDDPREWFDVQVVVQAEDFAPPAGLRAVHLLREPYVAVVPAGSPLAGETVVELARLQTERWIDNDVFRGWCRRNLLDACRAAGFSPPFHVETHDYRTAIAFVAAGIGITVLPRLGAADLPDGVVAVPLAGPTPERSIHAVVRERLEDAVAVRTAVAALQECAGREPR